LFMPADANPPLPTPIVAISACVKQIMAHQFHATNQRNLDAVAAHSGCFPIIMPSIGQRADPSALLDHISGLMLTGSPSNVHPDNYGDELAAPEITVDPQRDATTLPMIRAAVERGIPVFAICRGMQELNVALGGTLHQFVHLLPGKGDHRADRSKPPEQRGDLAHAVMLSGNGKLRQILGAESVMVNSLHAQAVAKPAPGLIVEATAEDGCIEGLSAPDAPGWVLGVQWHPEAVFKKDEPSRKLFEAFGVAVRDYASRRGHLAVAAE
jgi:putative glutamine amidotransferase